MEDKPGFTVVCPVHNEEEYLPYSLPSIYGLQPDEVLFVADRCTDGSVDMIKKHHHQWGRGKLTLVGVEENADTKLDYRFRPAYLRRLGYMKAGNEVILNTSADLVLDPSITGYLQELDDEVGMIRFGYLDYPATVRGFLRQLYSGFTPWKSMSGLYLFRREAWLRTENPENVKRVPKSEDTHLIQAIQSRYETRYYNTRTLHIRPDEEETNDMIRGRMYSQVMEADPLRVLLTSIAMLRPRMFKGYLAARRDDTQ